MMPEECCLTPWKCMRTKKWLGGNSFPQKTWKKKQEIPKGHFFLAKNVKLALSWIRKSGILLIGNALEPYNFSACSHTMLLETMCNRHHSIVRPPYLMLKMLFWKGTVIQEIFHCSIYTALTKGCIWVCKRKEKGQHARGISLCRTSRRKEMVIWYLHSVWYGEVILSISITFCINKFQNKLPWSDSNCQLSTSVLLIYLYSCIERISIFPGNQHFMDVGCSTWQTVLLSPCKLFISFGWLIFLYPILMILK